MAKTTDSNKIIANIKDSIKSVNIKGITFYWKYTIESHYKLLTQFEYKTAEELEAKLNNGDALTVLKVFWSGIIWGDDEIDFKDFMLFIDGAHSEEMVIIIDFIIKNLPEFLNVKKKRDEKIMEMVMEKINQK